MRNIILATISATYITKISVEVLEYTWYSGARGLNEISLETRVAVNVLKDKIFTLITQSKLY